MNDVNKKDSLDDFWDLGAVSPSHKSAPNPPQTALATSVDIPARAPLNRSNASESDTVIKRYIDPMHYENKKIKKEATEHSESYAPQSGLLHKVTLRKLKSSYNLYVDFLQSAKRYALLQGKEAPYVSWFSYVPQYDQLSREQAAYYLWWRDCFKRGELIKTDMSYVQLYVYELLNLGDAQDTELARDRLAQIWNCYYKDFPAIASKLTVWICDFCLLHKLPPPQNIGKDVMRYTPSLSEFFIDIQVDDLDRCTKALLKYGTEYDYRKSKFATDKNIDVFNRHVFGAVRTAVSFFSRDGRFLSELISEDSKVIRRAFDGALCASLWKYEIEVKYFSFSRSNELRFIIGDVVKYAENKIRAFLGIKSRLSVYSVSIELQNALNAYFEAAFAVERPVNVKKTEEKHEYDVLYEVSAKPFSLADAKKIENESWGTTNELLGAFEAEEDVDATEKASVSSLPEIVKQAEEATEDNAKENDLCRALGKYLEFARAVKRRDGIAIEAISKKLDMLPEAIGDIVNEISVEVIGDILIEDNGDGFEIIECYSDNV